uniref:Peptidase A2 domain-containing protein n=1 Tax=Strongyloides stercoralis TaxID=6248 RepID=A0A0K0EGR6_STRER
MKTEVEQLDMRISVKISSNKDGEYKKVRVYVDTGAQISLIKENYAKRLNLKLMAPTNKKIVTLGKSEIILTASTKIYIKTG